MIVRACDSEKRGCEESAFSVERLFPWVKHGSFVRFARDKQERQALEQEFQRELRQPPGL